MIKNVSYLLILTVRNNMILITKIIDRDDLKLYATDVNLRWDKETYQEYLDLLPAFIQAKLITYNNWKDRQLRILGKLLLKQLLIDFGSAHLSNLLTLKYTNNNRPYFEGNIDFSTTHAENKVMCAASIRNKVGLDIEFIKEVNPAGYYQYFSRTDIDLLEKSKDPMQLFYQLWTRKEALAKATGLGVMMPFESLSISGEYIEMGQEKYQITDLKIDENYKGALAILTLPFF